MYDQQTRFQSIVNVFQDHAIAKKNTKAFVFLSDGIVEKEHFTYSELDNKARSIANVLKKQAKPEDRILLCYAPGLEFIAAFMGCLYAHMIAVPAFPLRNNRHAERLRVIINDCQAKIVLTTSGLVEYMQKDIRFSDLVFLATDKVKGTAKLQKTSPRYQHEQIAFLQYTSGSTGDPKGVIVSHGNIIHNMQSLEKAFGFDQVDNKISTFWIPVQHDMSLIGEILVMMYVGGTGVMLSPTSFIERPINWLKAIQHYHAHYAAAPNFAYDLCVEKISIEEKSHLDLSCWRVAMNASEPVRFATLQRFSDAFKNCGFSIQQFMPAYGLAEVTLLVSGSPLNGSPIHCRIDKKLYEKGEFKFASEEENSIILTSSGSILWAEPEHEIKIVNPENMKVCVPCQMGEIWIKSPSVAQGYWQKPQATTKSFQAYLADGDGPYLRTGDLGILHAGELYITGRIKDIIILEGRNLYPQDIEAAVDACHPAVRLDCTAAFSIEIQGREQLVIVTEIERSARKQDTNAIFSAIRKAIIETAEVVPYDIKLLQPAQALKTTSGKIQRQATKQAYLTGTLKLHLPYEEKFKNASVLKRKSKNIADDLHRIYQQVLAVDSLINLDKKFSELGGDSFKAIVLYDRLCNYLDNSFLSAHLSPGVAFDYPTLREMIDYITSIRLGLQNQTIFEDISSQNSDDPIAIVGMSGRFPSKITEQIEDLETFWQLLINKQEAITEVPIDRWDSNNSTQYGAFINNIKYFDADFFNIAPVEAETMDPQQRLLLEITWHALENAGIDPRSLKGSDASVFVGASSHEFGDMLLKDEHHTSYVQTGNTLSVLAGRVSYFFGLRGPSFTIDTACSSSLVALHEACDSLKLGETKLAIVAGVNVLFSPDAMINLTKTNMLASDGHCKVFSENANGYVRGEGCGVIILKRLHQAKIDGDNILAVIKSTAVNQDGASSGLTVPNSAAQELLLHKSLQQAKLQPDAIDYLEIHGTGTKLGDPMELHAINSIYQDSHHNTQPLYIGSVKANIGHLEAAAGIAGIIKVLLSLQNEKIPAQIQIKALNPKINLTSIPAQIPQEIVPWTRMSNKVRRAGISSFGFSGTNAHIILEENLSVDYSRNLAKQDQHLLIISAKQTESLHLLIDKYIDYLQSTQDNIEDICYTSQVGRSFFECHAAVAGKTINDLIKRLKTQEYITDEQLAELKYPAKTKLKKVILPNYQFLREIFWPKTLEKSVSSANKTLQTAEEHYKLMLGKNAILDEMRFKPQHLRELLPEEVLVRVHYTGVNMRDVLAALNIYSGLKKEIGLECAGEVIAIGKRVTRFSPGDQVFGIALGSYSDVVITHQDLLVKKPEVLSFAGAATLPIAYLTAVFSLLELAKINPGDKVLIHAAAGGVGLAAVAVAQAVGAEIYATVSSDEKRAYLKKIGITHIYHSRNTQFAKQILNDTYNTGVDVVLNSLTSEGFIAASVACCAINARFIEIGRVNIWQPEVLAEIRADIIYHIMDIDNIIDRQPDTILHYLQYIQEQIISGTYSALPYREFPDVEIKNAFSYLQQAKNIGKAVVKNTHELPSTISANEINELQLDENNPQALHDFVCAQVCDVLGIKLSDLNETRGFFDLGMDSLTAAELNKRLVLALGDKGLTSTSVFDFPNVNALINKIIDTVNPSSIVNKLDTNYSQGAIAIIGMSCRMPHAQNIAEFWQLLISDQDTFQSFKETREKLIHLDSSDPDYTGSFLQDIDKFDADFFGISPAEAQIMDPQQRLLLQTSWEALENAGIAIDQNNDIGVYIGAAGTDFGHLLDNTQVNSSKKNAYGVTGILLSALSGRISYVLGLQGPSITCDTACSSSLVALHEACEALHAGECNIALAGGVNLTLDPRVFARFENAGILSANGCCQTFDVKADGYVRGEGCGVVVLKPLLAALNDQDHILAVIKGSVINQDGASSGFTVPNGSAQIRLMREALTKAKVSADSINYIETHGTGTSLGDPIEVNAIGEVYGRAHASNEAVILGALKSRIGHLEGASGIASVIKVVSCMQQQMLVKNLNFSELNPDINLNTNNVILALENSAWKSAPNSPRRAAVSSFGFTGTNAHVILEEASVQEKILSSSTIDQHLLIISAKTPTALSALILKYLAYLKETQDTIEHICYTSQVGRCLFTHQVAVTGKDIAELVNNLENSIYVSADKVAQYRYPAELRFNKASLPTYVFNNGHYWPEQLSVTHVHNTAIKGFHPLLGIATELGSLNGIVFDTTISKEYPTFIDDHRVFDVPIISGPAYVSALLSAIYYEQQQLQASLTHINFYQPCVLDNEKSYELQIYIDKSVEGMRNVTIQSREKIHTNYIEHDNWILHVSAELQSQTTAIVDEINFLEKVDKLQKEHTLYLSKSQLYNEFMLKKGSRIQGQSCWIDELWSDKQACYARLRLPGHGECNEDGFLLHPGCIESCIYMAAVLRSHTDKDATTMYLPFAIEKINYSLIKDQPPMWAYAELINQDNPNPELFQINAYLLSATGQIILQMQGIWLKLATQAAVAASLHEHSRKISDASMKTPLAENVEAALIYDSAQVVEIVRSHSSRILGTSQDDLDTRLDTGFMDMGMDSLSAVELAKELKKYFGEKIIPNATVLYNYPNIHALSDYIFSYCHQHTLLPSAINIKSTITEHDTIAIIGLSSRFPNSADITAFWDLLANGKSGISDIPATRWNIDTYYDADVNIPGKMCSRKGGFLDIAIDQFDATFFGINMREANYIDPQQRLLLETTWEALEYAGIDPTHLRGSRTGVFIGIWNSDYNQLLAKKGELTDITPYSALGGGLAEAAGRISYVLGLQGPSIAVDTVCSSSLVALHQACQSLQLGDCDTALVGGVNLLLDPATSIGFSQLHMLAPDGYCKTFDASANGYVRGEGCGILVLKRLQDAKNDGDNILAVIKASGVNQDGASSGFTAPNGLAQEKLMREVLAKANLAAADITYLETHGTGTELGDPIEVGAIAHVYGENRTANNPLVLGALKTNIGHLEAAAGVASLTKAILVLQHELIPSNLQFKNLNPKIDIQSIPAVIPVHSVEWKRNSLSKRYVAISAFGASGTNAHVILGEAPVNNKQESNITQLQHLLLISAKTESALQQQISRYISYLKQTKEDIKNICYTSQVGRALFTFQVAVMGEQIADLICKLENKEFLAEQDIVSYKYPDDTYLRKVILPFYAFERKSHWVEIINEKHIHSHISNTIHPLLGQGIQLGNINSTIFLAEVSKNYPDFVADHSIFDVPLISGPAYLSAIISGLFFTTQQLHGHIKQINFHQPLAFLEDNVRQLQILISSEEGKQQEITINSQLLSCAQKQYPWILHASAILVKEDNANNNEQNRYANKIIDLPNNHSCYLTGKEFYTTFLMQLGTKIQGHSCWIEELWSNATSCLARLRLPGTNEGKSAGYFIHPGCIESCFSIAALLQAQQRSMQQVCYLPYAIDEVQYNIAQQQEPMWAYVELAEVKDNIELIKVNGYLLTANGDSVLTVSGLWIKMATQQALLQSIESSVDPISVNVVQENTSVKPLLSFDHNQVLEIVRSHVSMALGIDQASLATQLDQGFIQLGMDSLNAVEIANNLKRSFGEMIIPNATILYNYVNINKLSNYIYNQCVIESPVGKKNDSIIKPNNVTAQAQASGIAIIGMSGCFPEAQNMDAFWKLLIAGSDAIAEVPAQRWPIDKFYDSDVNAPGKMNSRYGGFLNIPIDHFDADFFSISRREANYIDPQQRLLLENTWHALEDALISPNELRDSRTGVYVGIWNSDYVQLLGKNTTPEDIVAYSGVGCGLAEAAGRISYLFGLQGPSIAVNTACSSSLVALHQACLGLYSGDCDTAILAGVNMLIDPAVSIAFSKMHMLSPEGHCKTFDADANGYVRGEGCGVFILKRLQDAQQNGDNILAVIKASGVNQDGASSGFAAPNGLAQEKLMREVLNKAKLMPKDITYIESHGTGTELGDPIEAGAIATVYGEDRKLPLVIGAVKSNIGHLEAAAGVASLAKVILSLQHETIPPNINFKKLNSKINFENSPVIIPVTAQNWISNDKHARHAAISAFGATGTNAHVIIEEAPADNFIETDVTRSLHLLIISAKTEAALQQVIYNYLLFLENSSENIINICYSTQVGRSLLEYHVGVVGESIEELCTKLKNKQYVAEEEINTLRYSAQIKRKRVKLPYYPFQHKQYWAEAQLCQDMQSKNETIRDNHQKNINISRKTEKKLADPKQAIEKDVKNYIVEQARNVLGLQKEEEIDVNKTFIELGFDSLMIVEFTNYLKKIENLQLELNANTLYDYPTIEKLSAYINNQTKPNNNYSPLCCFKKEGTNAALFCIHGVDGHAEVFLDLATHMQINRPVYVLQGIEKASNIHVHTLEERAAFYIQAMQTIQAHGPYYLLGWSMGGAIALEVTRQLYMMHEKIAFLGVIDGMLGSINNTKKKISFKDAAKFFLYFYDNTIHAQAYNTIDYLNNGRLLKFIQETAHIANMSLEQIKNEILIVQNNFNELLKYTANMIEQPLILFSPKKKRMPKHMYKFSPLLSGSDSIEWRKLSKKVKKHIVDGDHFTMLDSQHNLRLEKYLEDYLSES